MQDRTLRWFTASTTSGKRCDQSFAAPGDEPDADGVAPGQRVDALEGVRSTAWFTLVLTAAIDSVKL